ncbi:hypothetical protein F4825DRAFT_302893 [Nemania diffusa]|nr:hypothetical protein F4825DRAFT_302893 [Nemania diffusa]
MQEGILNGPKAHDPSVTIPQIIHYLRDGDAGRDTLWNVNFPLIRDYLAEAHRAMVTGDLGYSDVKLRAALEDARVMVNIHRKSEKYAWEKSSWTTDILRGQTTQERLLTYPKVFPLPKPDRAKSRYRPIKPIPRPNDKSSLWNGKSLDSTDIDDYVKSENKFFRAIQKYASTGKKNRSRGKNNQFDIQNQAYEKYMSRGVAETCFNAPAPAPNNDGRIGPKGAKDPSFYDRRGWQRAALQQCLNLFTNHENRVINTPWRRAVLPYDPPAALPKEVAYVPRITEPSQVTNEKEKDPFSWLHWSFEYTRIVDFLADCQRQHYNNQCWDDFSASALPTNFRGPRIYRGLAAHDQYWLKIGESLDQLENMLHSAWGAAPRPLLRAILRDIDAGKQERTGPTDTDSSYYVPAEDGDEIYERKRYWRRDIKRRLKIDNREDNANDDNFKLIDGFDSAWLRYLCEPSRTLEMCDPSKQPKRNLLILFDTKLQSYFRNLEVSGTPDSKALHIWTENIDEIDKVMHDYKPNTLRMVLAYINGCTEDEVIESGDMDSNPEHPNASYQFSREEAEFLCVELHSLGRCVYIPDRGDNPAVVGRPRYNVHPEDRVLWRYVDSTQFQETSAEYVDDMVDHYDAMYGNWSLYKGDRPSFSRELEHMMDHAGSDFTPELERIETQYPNPGTKEASATRRAFIRRYIVPEGLSYISDLLLDSTESERDSPYRDDLATWEMVGAYLTRYHEQQKELHNPANYYYSGELYEPQTPERTVQFFRNIAYRMGRTMRYVDQIRERLHYLENGTQQAPSKLPLDLSAELKEPRPDSNDPANTIPVPNLVEHWWQPVSVRDYNLAIEKWSTAIQEGSGEVALMPPDIKEVLVKADPDSSSQNPLKGDQDPFTVIREGIIEDCFQNRPTMYPGRLSGFKDQDNKEFQGYQRPQLFDWATKDQRRYQAQHTRRHFFNMQRWPPSRILPHRLEAIRNRKDEVARVDPSKPDQAYGILTERLPRGRNKPIYAHPIIDHHHHGRDPDDWLGFNQPLRPPPNVGVVVNDASRNATTANNDISSSNVAADNQPLYDDIPSNNIVTNNNISTLNSIPTDSNVAGSYAGDIDDAVSFANPVGTAVDKRINNKRDNMVIKGTKTTSALGRKGKTASGVPYARSDERFAPGPAVFPMGDTLLQKVLISHELSNALYPSQPFYKDRLLGLRRVWQKLVGVEPPPIPLVPQVARANIPRSNPNKRKMPIEFLNGSGTTKKFRSDAAGPLQPGGIGGQFAAALAASDEDLAATDGKASTRKDFSEGSYTYDPKTGRLTKQAQAQSTTIGGTVTSHAVNEEQNIGSMKQPPANVIAGDIDNIATALDTEAGDHSEGLYRYNPNDGMLFSHGKAQVTVGGKATTKVDTGFHEIGRPARRLGNNPSQPTGNLPGASATPLPTGNIMGGKAISQPAENTSQGTSLRLYPDPSRQEARTRFMDDFPHGWLSTPTELQSMLTTAMTALEFSINHQFTVITNMRTTQQELNGLAQAQASLQPYIQTPGQNRFDIHALSRLVDAFGEYRGYRLQLGVVQEEANIANELQLPGAKKFAAYLVGSKFSQAVDKMVVWVRLAQVQKYPGYLLNDYNGVAYNCFKGVSYREKQ